MLNITGLLTARRLLRTKGAIYLLPIEAKMFCRCRSLQGLVSHRTVRYLIDPQESFILKHVNPHVSLSTRHWQRGLAVER